MNIEEFEKDVYDFDDENMEKYSKQDYFNYYLNKENKNDNEMNILGFLYNKGFGTEKNYEKAVEWYTLSANKGNYFAQNNLGNYYRYTEKNYEKAVEWYTLSANQGNSIAQYNLGIYYYDNKNYEKAVEWYTLSANQGNSIAKCYLGVYYKTIEKNYEEAIKWYTLSANQGNKYAQDNLGFYYETIEKNYEEALKWYTLAKNEKKIKLLKSKQIKLSKKIEIDEQEECSICKDSFLNNNKSVLTIQCGHSYHYDCLKQWQMKCPLCFIDIN